MLDKTIKRYRTKDGRAVLSPFDLHYALASDCTLALDKVEPGHMKKLTIIADPDLDTVLRCTENARPWESVDTAMADRRKVDPCRHYCLLKDGVIYINDGGYKPLNEFISSASEEAKDYVLAQIAYQSALAQMAMAKMEADARAKEDNV